MLLPEYFSLAAHQKSSTSEERAHLRFKLITTCRNLLATRTFTVPDTFKLRRNDLGIVEHQRIAGLQKFGEFGNTVIC